MKKKLLITIMVLALMCVLAFSVSATTVTTYDDAPTRENIIVSTDDVVVFNDGFACPSAYVFKDSTYLDQKAKMFDFTYINGKTGKTYTYESIVEVDIPQGVKSSASYAFAGHASLKRVSLPNTFTSIGDCFFERVASLQECVFEHDENSGLETIPSWMFAYCTSLKAICFPDCVKYIKGNNQLGGCTNLTAIYLSKNLIYTEGGSNAGGTFAHLTNGYFVNTPFTYDNIPTKPDVYFFPANYYTMTGEVFDTSKNLNKVLVFTANNITITNGWTFENSACDSNGTKPIIVFTGDVTSVSVGSWNVSKIYFANANDKSSSDMTLSGSKTFVFCNAEGNTDHLTDPRKTQTTEADCLNNEKTSTYCFCSALIGTTEVENTALGHNHDLENGATLLDIVYADYSKDGYKVVKCSRCDNENNEQKANAIIYDFTGYSTRIDGNGITFGYSIDREALAELKAFSANLQVGFVVAAAPLLGDNMPLDANADPTVLQKGNVIKTDISQYDDISKVDFVLVGSVWDSKLDLDGDGDAETLIKDIKFVMCGYVYAKDAVQYIGANGASEELPGISYGEIE